MQIGASPDCRIESPPPDQIRMNLPTRMPLLSKHWGSARSIGLESKCAGNGSGFMHSRPFLRAKTFSGTIQTRSPFGSRRDAGEVFGAKTSIRTLHPLLSGDKSQPASPRSRMPAPSIARPGFTFPFSHPAGRGKIGTRESSDRNPHNPPWP
jgi:hypothetical protein